MVLRKIPESTDYRKMTWDLVEAVEKLNSIVDDQREQISDLIKDREANLAIMEKVNVNMSELIKMVQAGKKI